MGVRHMTRALRRPDHRHLARAQLAALAVTIVVGASLALAPAQAAPLLAWSAPATFDSGATPNAVSCASESLCVAVDSAGEAFSTSDATATNPFSSPDAIDHGQSLNAVSCAPGGPCVAVDGRGDAFVNPESGSSKWEEQPLPNGGKELTGVSCPTSSLCVAVDREGDVLTSTSPGSGDWTASAALGQHLTGVSCSSPSLCVAVDSAGEVLASANPTGGAADWSLRKVDSEELLAVSCWTAGACVAVDAGGDALVSADPTAASATWSLTPIDGERLTAVSCASSGLCIAVDGHGGALASDDPTAPVPDWTTSSPRPDSTGLAGIACLAGGFCVALDTTGHSLGARVPSPSATTVKPTEVTDASATLAGVVDPNDAVLGSCSFEYGTEGAGGPNNLSIACAVLPAAIGGAQDVSAQLSGLSPNTTYGYRVLASSPRGSGVGASEAFTTPASSQVALVHPSPSITGTPANGQVLKCHAGTPAGATAQLSYAWLRDLIPIAGADAATYTVKGQDTGHHLQCQVTATDGGGSASAKSAFVTIPVGGAPASAGETAVGTAAFKSGKVSVPITCSSLASRGCEVDLRLTTIESLSGRRIVAVAARSRPSAHRSAATLRHVTVTLASVSAHLAPGAHGALAAALSATGRRLLSAERRFTAYAYVSGTVIGVIEAQLAHQLVVLVAAPRARRAQAHASIRPVVTNASGRASNARPTARLTATTSAKASVLAATPYMGWDTYLGFGADYSEATVLRQASELISLGLEPRGYRYVWLDVGWWHGTRNADGEITVSPTQWPHGLAWLARTLHEAGFLVGLYTDAGPNGCGGAGQGSYGHYQQDVNTFAAWGFDAVKVDFCGGEEYGLNPAAAYSAFHAAIEANSSHRQMLLSICDYLQPEQYGEGRPVLDESAFSSYSFGPSVGNSWRTDTDVGFPGNVSFASVLRNMDADAAAPQAAGPGHWNDPDYLAPDQGMSAAQFRTQLSMWSMLAAPLMISRDLTKLSPASLAAVQNLEVIAIDQDPAGVQGTLLSSLGNGQVWVKPLIDGSRAVALLNRGSSPIAIETSASAVGLPAASSYSLRNVWAHTTSSSHGTISAEVPPDSTVLLRVSAG
jgi:hypothetical protein